MFGLFRKRPRGVITDGPLSTPSNVTSDAPLSATTTSVETWRGASRKVQLLVGENRADLDFLVDNLDLFAGGFGNSLQFYWFRSHPEKLDNELLCFEVPWLNVGEPETDSEILVALEGPDFSSLEQANLAFDLVIDHTVETVKVHSKVKNIDPDDLTVFECCKRLMTRFDPVTLRLALTSEALAFQSRLEVMILDSFTEETAHLYKILEKKKPYLKPKFMKANRINYDEFGEPEKNNINTTVREMLRGINLEDSYAQRFRLFSQAWDNMAPQAVAHMSAWAEDFSDELTIPMDGFKFEEWVANRLNKYGWIAYATKGSGDQGVDVVATKDDMSIGIQCKRYSSSVGNKAVQEIYAGAKHMGLDKAAVLTNAEFTRSAKELADSTGVLLLSPEDIPELNKRLQN